MDNPEISREEWLKIFHELETQKEIYVRFEFPGGHGSAKLSNLEVSGRTTLLLQRRSTPSEPDSIELQLSLSERGLPRYEKMSGANATILSIVSRIQSHYLIEAMRVRLSNTADFSTGADS